MAAQEELAVQILRRALAVLADQSFWKAQRSFAMATQLQMEEAEEDRTTQEEWALTAKTEGGMTLLLGVEREPVTVLTGSPLVVAVLAGNGMACRVIQGQSLVEPGISTQPRAEELDASE